ncbi:MAG: ABC transporter ATP-binding protein [Myxococcota bacterium]|nr:ABC transporter ATP-binding protein [Myxococcota bacterium]
MDPPNPTHARVTFTRLARYARPYVAVLLLAILCAGAYAGARAGRAWLLQPLFDEVILPSSAAGNLDLGGFLPALGGEAPPDASDGPEAGAPDPEERARLEASVRESLPRILWAALLIVALLPLAHLGQVYLSQYVLGRVLVDIQQDLCSKLLSLPLRFHHRASRGDLLSRVMNDTQRAHVALEHLLVDVVQSLLALAVGVGLLLYISWQLTLLLAVVAPVLALVIAAFGRSIRRGARRRQESQADITARLVQILSGIKVIKSFSAERAEESDFGQENLRLFRRGMRVVRSRTLARTVVEGMNNAIGVAIILLGAAVVVQGFWGLTLGALSAYVLVMQSTYRPVKDLTKGWTRLMDALPSADRFFELLDAEGETRESVSPVRFEGLREGVSLANVSFAYEDEPVLRDVSLDVAAGQVVAIVGRTGAGKTTLADLLLRFHDPDEGTVRIDGIDLRDIERSSWLSRVAVVTQEPFLFPGSIADNIRYGRREASDAEIESAARAAHVDEFAEGLPQGYDTDVGDAGVRLSGGQRQRITLARAILRDPDVLVLDEATSALDAKSERYVHEALDALLPGRTVFVIAHRLSTIRSADRIVVLDKGAVVETGSHEELLDRAGGIYRELVELQSERANLPD